MAVRILKQGPYLIATVQAAMTDSEAIGLRDDLMHKIGAYRSRGVIVDVTALDVMDSFAARSLRSIASRFTPPERSDSSGEQDGNSGEDAIQSKPRRRGRRGGRRRSGGEETPGPQCAGGATAGPPPQTRGCDHKYV